HAILVELRDKRLHESRSAFRNKITEWSAQDLLVLQQSFKEARAGIETRLEAVNEILAGLPYGEEGDRRSITVRPRQSAEVSQFRDRLHSLSSRVTELASQTDEQMEDRYVDLARFMDHLQSSSH